MSKLSKITTYNLTIPQLETAEINLHHFDTSAKQLDEIITQTENEITNSNLIKQIENNKYIMYTVSAIVGYCIIHITIKYIKNKIKKCILGKNNNNATNPRLNRREYII